MWYDAQRRYSAEYFVCAVSKLVSLKVAAPVNVRLIDVIFKFAHFCNDVAYVIMETKECLDRVALCNRCFLRETSQQGPGRASEG